MVFNKLVRDKIPQIIESNGGKANVRVLSKEEYARYLEEKLDEEVAEYHRDHTIEELADVLEVVYALSEEMGYTRSQLEEIHGKKHRERGGFAQRYLLISTET